MMKVKLAILILRLIGISNSLCYAGEITFNSSSEYDRGFQAQNSFDGDGGTRWASKSEEVKSYLEVDFGEVLPVKDMVIKWEVAFAAEYEIAISADHADWQVIATETNGKEGAIEHKGINANGRYVRINCIKKGPHGLYSIWEVSFASKEINEKLQGYFKQIELRKRQAIKKRREQLGCKEIVFAQRRVGNDPHWYANFGYYAEDANRKPHKPGGQLCKYNLDTEELTILLDDAAGSVRDPIVHYDAKKILFSYRKGDENNFHLWEINIDGSGLKQLTDGPYDDFEPTYLPDGKIMFVSSRGNRWVNCWLTQVAVLYRCDGDGQNIHQISANIEHDNTPWVLPDGRILYTRWEYIDRSQVHYHHLWTTNPDGTNQTVYYGNFHPGSVYIDAKPIPGTGDVLMIDSPGHGATEHNGHVALVTDKYGPDNIGAKKIINSQWGFRDPYPLSDDAFIVANDRTIQLMGSDGSAIVLYKINLLSSKLGYQCHEPRPIMKRQREAIIPDRINLEEATGKLLLTNVYIGRNMGEVEKGTVKKLLIMETLPKPINYTGGMDPLTYGGTFTLERILGTVPVEADGSAYMELPANRSVFFIALDKDDNAVKRMQSFTSVAPGELSSCIGCHEERTTTPDRVSAMAPMAAMKQANKPTPIAGIPQLFDFPRDIQPILDKHCVKCHNPDNRNAKVLLAGDHGPMFSHSYMTLTMHRQFIDGRNNPVSNFPPYSLGAYPSPLMKKVLNKHHDVNLSENEIKKIRFWIESAAVYPGTYAALGTGMIGGYQENYQRINADYSWPESIKAAAAIENRCSECHKDHLRLPTKLSDERGISFWRPDWNDKALMLSRHTVFNLSHPEKSLMLLAPLAKTAGGYAIDTEDKKEHPIVFKDKTDKDYQAILGMVQAGKDKLEEVTRFDMANFRPRDAYIREMKRYGVLPSEFDLDKDGVNVYKLDELYWQSLWYDPKGANESRYPVTMHDKK
ncbi:MAG: discoidin domain-containing protein [Phycisphaerae bacterium]|nr:discoidin domain-containing protein [Phycisphaerae bacterium]